MSGPGGEGFGASRACFEDIVGWLDGTESSSASHAELEDDLDRRGRDLLRRLLQDHLDLRARREERVAVVSAVGVTHGSVEAGHIRRLTTVFGPVVVERLAYRRRGAANLHPADGALNLPTERQLPRPARLAPVESARAPTTKPAAQAMSEQPGWRWPSARWRSPPPGVQPTSTTSTRPARPSPLPATTSCSSPSTARASSCAPTRCAPPPSERLRPPRPSSPHGCPCGEKRNRKRLPEVGAV